MYSCTVYYGSSSTMTSVPCVGGQVVIRWFCRNMTLLTSVKFYLNLICGELNNIYEFNTLGDFDRKRKSGKANK